jgi:cyclopropane fatty-acyl-phospholipid synthase-like methyltransferase
VRDTIEANVRTVREHYDSLFGLVDRAKSFEEAGFARRPPIVNMGYWLKGAKTAREAQEQMVRELASRIGDLKGRRILDAGCGLCGPAMILACDYGAVVDGVNIVEQQVKWARRFIEANAITDKVRAHIASAMDYPFPARAFDVVFSLEAAHCFVDKERFLRESYRVLRDDGLLVLADIVGTAHLPIVNWQPALKLKLVTASDWDRMLASCGFARAERIMIGDAVYPGCRWWADQTAPERRKAIFTKSFKPGASLLTKKLLEMRASLLEFLYFRSLLLLMSRLRLREYVLFVASKRPGGEIHEA